jgi:hypothetical protein
MSRSFGITYKQLLPKLFLPAGPSATKHGPNNEYLREDEFQEEMDEMRVVLESSSGWKN